MKAARWGIAVLVAATLAACGGQAKKAGGAGGVSVSVSAVTFDNAPVAKVIVTLDGGSAVVATPSAGVFHAAFEKVEAGAHTISAEARLEDDTVIATGSAPATVVVQNVAKVSLFLYDTRARQSLGTLPIVESVTADSASIFSDQKVKLSAKAIDFDGGAIAYNWSESAPCGGSFDDAASPSPVWTPPAKSGNCTLLVVVSDPWGPRDAQFSQAFVVVSVDNTGGIDATGTIVAPPQVLTMTLAGPNGTCVIDPNTNVNPNPGYANCGDWLNFFRAGDAVAFEGAYLAPPAGVTASAAASLACGGAPAIPLVAGTGGSFAFTVPAKPAGLFQLACEIVYTVTFGEASGSVSTTLPLVFGVP